jgi:hypothetical protein
MKLSRNRVEIAELLNCKYLNLRYPYYLTFLNFMPFGSGPP